MKPGEILQLRLTNQQITRHDFANARDLVTWMIAMQAQEYAMAKWAIGLRLGKGYTDAQIEKAFNEGAVLRTHLMRPTWHFVSPEDIRWLVQLTAPRVHALNAFTYRQQELDKKLLNKAANILVRKLEEGSFLTRTELQEVLSRNKIKATGIRLAAIFMYAELELLICSGPRIGKQFSYALMDKRVPVVPALSRDEALAQFAARYFASRGPATVTDFSYWSGLAVKDCRDGAASLPRSFTRITLDGDEYFFKAVESGPQKNMPSFLMPDYDEYGMSYKDRSILFRKVNRGSPLAWNRMIIINGQIEGTWQRVMKGKDAKVDTALLPGFPDNAQSKLRKAISDYITFTR